MTTLASGSADAVAGIGCSADGGVSLSDVALTTSFFGELPEICTTVTSAITATAIVDNVFQLAFVDFDGFSRFRFPFSERSKSAVSNFPYFFVINLLDY